MTSQKKQTRPTRQEQVDQYVERNQARGSAILALSALLAGAVATGRPSYDLKASEAAKLAGFQAELLTGLISAIATLDYSSSDLAEIFEECLTHGAVPKMSTADAWVRRFIETGAAIEGR